MSFSSLQNEIFQVLTSEFSIFLICENQWSIKENVCLCSLDLGMKKYLLLKLWMQCVLVQDFPLPYRYKMSFKQVIWKTNFRDVKFPSSSRYSLINFCKHQKSSLSHFSQECLPTPCFSKRLFGTSYIILFMSSKCYCGKFGNNVFPLGQTSFSDSCMSMPSPN